MNSRTFLPEYFTFEPEKVFIMNSGKIKVINNEIMDGFDEHRNFINESVYYAPEKIEDFD